MKIDKSYIPALDGFRAVAILVVVAAHFGLKKFVPGGFGVTLFFFVSGFLITRLLVAEYSGTGTIDLKKFYIRRFLRLYPPLIVMVLVTCTYLTLFGSPVSGSEVLSSLFYFTNYFVIFFKDYQLYDYSSFNILWSLAVEEHFYIFFPLIMLVFRSKKILIPVLSGLIAIALFWRGYLVLAHDDISWVTNRIYFLTDTRYDAILMGCLLTLLIHFDSTSKIKSLLTNQKLFIASLLVLLSTFVIRDEFFRNTLRYTLQELALLVIVPSVLYASYLDGFRRILEMEFMIFIGKLSYSIYLFHWVALQVVEYLSIPELQHQLTFLVVTTIAMSLSSYMLVEQPIIGLRKRFGSNVAKTYAK